MTVKEQIIKKINNIVNIATYDINTYTWARTKLDYVEEKYNNENRLGGGNIVSTAYLFNSINFLSKIHNILISKKRIFSDHSDLDKYDQVKIELKKIKCLGKTKPFLGKPILGEINEMNAFVLLCQNLDLKKIPLISTTIQNDPKKLEALWNNWRNRIAHMGIQSKGSIKVLELVNSKTKKNITDYIEIKNFIKDSNDISIDENHIIVEFLVRDINRISSYLENLIITKPEDSFEIQELITWLELTDSEDCYYSIVY